MNGTEKNASANGETGNWIPVLAVNNSCENHQTLILDFTSKFNSPPEYIVQVPGR